MYLLSRQLINHQSVVGSKQNLRGVRNRARRGAPDVANTGAKLLGLRIQRRVVVPRDDNGLGEGLAAERVLEGGGARRRRLRPGQVVALDQHGRVRGGRLVLEPRVQVPDLRPRLGLHAGDHGAEGRLAAPARAEAVVGDVPLLVWRHHARVGEGPEAVEGCVGSQAALHGAAAEESCDDYRGCVCAVGRVGQDQIDNLRREQREVLDRLCDGGDLGGVEGEVDDQGRAVVGRERIHLGRGDDAKVGPSAPEGPVEIRIARARGRDRLPAGSDHAQLEDVVDGEAVLPKQVAVSAAESCSEGSNAVAVAGLDQDAGGVGGCGDIAYDGAPAYRGRRLVSADVDLVQAGQVDENAVGAQVELACRPPVAAILGDEADVVVHAVLDLETGIIYQLGLRRI